MQAPGERDLRCPRCRYDLRGQTVPRCPECGLTFDDEQWRSGVLREHVPTALDRCDPWQPHQVLLRSLYELVRGAIRPGRLLSSLDLRGPLSSAILMFVFGSLWVYLLASILVAIAICVHGGASPAISLETALLYWSPRLLMLVYAIALLLCPYATLPFVTHAPRATFRQYLRLELCWIPTVGVYALLPLVLLVATPTVALQMPRVWTLLIALPAATLVFRSWRNVGEQAGTRRVDLIVQIAAALAGFAVIATGSRWLATQILPLTLEPPLWVYF